MAALISNMESAALGSQSLHPPSLLCDSRLPSLLLSDLAIRFLLSF